MANTEQIETTEKNKSSYTEKLFKKTMGEFLISLGDSFEEYSDQFFQFRKNLKEVSSSVLLQKYILATADISDLLTVGDFNGIKAIGKPLILFGDFDLLKLLDSSENFISNRDAIWDYVLHFQVCAGRNILKAKQLREAKPSSPESTGTDSAKSGANDSVSSETRDSILNGIDKLLKPLLGENSGIKDLVKEFSENKALSSKETIEKNGAIIGDVVADKSEDNQLGKTINELTSKFFTDNKTPEELFSGKNIFKFIQDGVGTIMEKEKKGEIDINRTVEQAQALLGKLELGGMEKLLDLNGPMGKIIGNLGNLGGLAGLVGGGENEADKELDEIAKAISIPKEFQDRLKQEAHALREVGNKAEVESLIAKGLEAQRKESDKIRRKIRKEKKLEKSKK